MKSALDVNTYLEIFSQAGYKADMDTKEAGRLGGMKAWKNTTARERSAIMRERNLKAWRTTRRPVDETVETAIEPPPSAAVR